MLWREDGTAKLKTGKSWRKICCWAEWHEGSMESWGRKRSDTTVSNWYIEDDLTALYMALNRRCFWLIKETILLKLSWLMCCERARGSPKTVASRTMRNIWRMKMDYQYQSVTGKSLDLLTVLFRCSYSIVPKFVDKSSRNSRMNFIIRGPLHARREWRWEKNNSVMPLWRFTQINSSFWSDLPTVQYPLFPSCFLFAESGWSMTTMTWRSNRNSKFRCS